jgi:hypothetical protein
MGQVMDENGKKCRAKTIALLDTYWALEIVGFIFIKNDP